jgi:hypothetical protein
MTKPATIARWTVMVRRRPMPVVLLVPPGVVVELSKWVNVSPTESSARSCSGGHGPFGFGRGQGSVSGENS